MYSNNQSFKFYPKFRMFYWLIPTCFILFGLALYAAICHLHEDDFERIDGLNINHINIPFPYPIYISTFWFSVMAAALCLSGAVAMLWVLWQTVKHKESWVIIDQDGLILKNTFFYWDDIALVGAVTISGYPLIGIVLKNPEKYFSERTFRRSYHQMGYHYAIGNIDASIQDVVDKAQYMFYQYNVQLEGMGSGLSREF